MQLFFYIHEVRISSCSPGLTVVTSELSAVVRQRRSVLTMKSYLTVCRLAVQLKLLRLAHY